MVCVGEFPLLAQYLSRYESDGFEILGVTVDSECDKAIAAVDRHGLSWPQICQGEGMDGEIANLYHVVGTPTYVVVERDGSIAGRTMSGAEAGDLIQAALASEDEG